MDFSTVVGQENAKSVLKQMVNNDRVPHAQLFAGQQGTGGLPMAMAFAKLLLCTAEAKTEACGVCNACQKVEKHIHPDVHFSFPTIGSKMTSSHFMKEWRTAIQEHPYMDVNQWLAIIGGENKQGNITKDECLNIVKKLSLKSYEGSYKILIMWLPEYLGKEGNRLLKLIEEPPEQTIFLLVAEQTEKILNTILSRCQLIKLPLLQDEEIVEALIAKGIDKNKAEETTFLADGNFQKALSISSTEGEENEHLFLDWFRKCYMGKPVELVNITDKIAKLGREYQKQLLHYGLNFFREFLILKTIGKENTRLRGKEKTTAENMTKVMGFEQVEGIAELLSQTVFHVERNANPKTTFLDTSIKIHKVLRRK